MYIDVKVSTVSSARWKAAWKVLGNKEKWKIMKAVTKTDAMGFVRDVVKITPPGSQKGFYEGTNGGAGLKAGKIAIYRDLKQVFTPLDDAMVDHAVESGIWGNTQRLFVTKNGTVYGCEQSLFRPDASNEALYDHHRKYFKNGRMTRVRTFGMDQANSVGKWKFITKLVIRKSAFDRYKNYVYEKIGILAGGWYRAAKKLGIRDMPSRHKYGGCDIIITNFAYRVVITQSVPYASQADMHRRIQWVMNSYKRKARTDTRIKYAIRSAAKRLGLTI